MDEKVKRLLEREGTGISWADLTFNPWIGCQKVSPACDHCYAEGLATSRLGVEWGPGAERRKTAKGTWQKLARWQRIAADAGVTMTVFSGSLCDIFDNAVDDSWRIQLGAEIAAAPNLRFMLLTKRLPNAEAMLQAMFPEGVPANVALGVTICNQVEADRDLPRAVALQASLGIERLFVSAEPLLGPLQIRAWLDRPPHHDARTRGKVGLLIVGGESGVDARPMNPAWVLALRDQAADAGCPFHFKQWGEWCPRPADYQAKTGTRGHLFRDGNDVLRLGLRKAGARLDGKMHREHFE